MMNFYDLHKIYVALYLMLIFVILCIGTGCLFLMIVRRNVRGGIAAFFSCVVTLTVLVLYSSNTKASITGWALPDIVVRFSEMPLIVSLLLVGISGTIVTVLLIKEHIFFKSNINHSSVKESIDHLNTGLCFARKNGTVMLTNYIMLELGFAIVGEDIQNAVLFWNILENGQTSADAERLSYGQVPEFRLADGRIWTFRREILDDIVQITATDTTELHRLMDRLRAENKELETMYRRIREYGDKVDQYVIAKERLETRVNIHSFLGQALLTTRHYLQYGNGNIDRIVNMWHRNIEVLRLEAEPGQPTDAFDSLITTARSLGMKVSITGELPQKPQIKRLMALTGAETLTNAVQHAGATTVFITLTETNDEYTALYTNDGKVPETDITEGGGLSSLRSKIEYAGGTMDIKSKPVFALTVKFRKGVKEHDQRTDS